MRRWVAILLCTAMLAIAVPAFAGGKCPGTENCVYCNDCTTWVLGPITVTVGATGVHVSFTATVGDPATNCRGTSTGRWSVARDDEFECTGACGSSVIASDHPLGTGTVTGGGPHDIEQDFPVDTSTPHEIYVLWAQDACVNCSTVASVQIEPLPTPTPPPVCNGEVIGYEWYECNSGSWTYGPATSADCAWCNGLSGNRVVKESYDCGVTWHWYYNGTPVSCPPVSLGFYHCDCEGK
jgi:hypothetical protein